jgi:Fe(II)/alpha-ketoglutarate-dependent arginine beta-hydroxylase
LASEPVQRPSQKGSRVSLSPCVKCRAIQVFSNGNATVMKLYCNTGLPSMNTLELTKDESECLKRLGDKLATSHSSSDDPDFLRAAGLLAHDVPSRVRTAIADFRLSEPTSGIYNITGFPIHDEKIGRTPCSCLPRAARSTAFAEEAVLVLIGSLLGDVFGWVTQQDGRIVHDVMPIESHQDRQLGTGSLQTLWWHNEDAFHPFNGDYLIIMCLRNPNGVATTIGSLESIQLSPEEWTILSSPLYSIRPDESHREGFLCGEEQDERRASAFGKISEMEARPATNPVLWGDPSSPYMRLDPYFMDPLRNNPAAQAAIDSLTAQIERSLTDLVLEPGDFCLIDNYKAVHGRRPFSARFDGRDRWLKRINVTRDLRKSRGSRSSTLSRIIG